MSELTLEEKAKVERAAYAREWRKKNPEKVRQNNKRYWERRALKKEQAMQAEKEKCE